MFWDDARFLKVGPWSLLLHSQNLYFCLKKVNLVKIFHLLSFPGGWDGKESTCNAGDSGSVPGLGRSAGEGYPLQYSCLENPMDKRAWQVTVYRMTKRWHDWATNTSTFFHSPEVFSLVGYSFFFKVRLILVCTLWKRFQGILLRTDNCIWKVEKLVFD